MINNFENYVLVLPSWYPSKVDAFNGDFNERFVKAAALYKNQIVVYIVKDDRLEKVEIDVEFKLGIITYIIYYPKRYVSALKKYKLFKLYTKVFSEIFETYGLPKLVHTYVFYPAGVISLYLKYRYGIKSLLTENWTTFYEEQINYINNNKFFKKVVYKCVLNSFDVVISVANRLQKEIFKWNKKSRNYVIPNVVDTSCFNFDGVVLEQNSCTLKFLHASTMGYQKNVDGILNVFERILTSHQVKINLVLAGSYNSEIINRINKSIILSNHVVYIGEISYEQVAKEMKNADAFILFSRYENMPCVLLESLCCGLPIIASRVGGIAEIINDGNGLLVDNEREDQLENAIIEMVSNYSKYDRKKISDTSIAKYSYDNIGKELNAIYKSLYAF